MFFIFFTAPATSIGDHGLARIRPGIVPHGGIGELPGETKSPPSNQRRASCCS
jgi:hypothetical protein